MNRPGFTLLEVMVALVILALLAMLAWQGIASMVDTRERVRQRSSALLGLQTGLAQWQADLNAHTDDNVTLGILFDGQSLRFTRRDSQDASQLRVVAWAKVRQELMRWQSAALSKPKAVRQAWRAAQAWAQSGASAAADLGAPTVHRITPVTDWSLAYFYGDGWTNALSSAQSQNATTNSGVPENHAPNGGDDAVCDAGLRCVTSSVPEQPLALRMTLNLPASAEQPWSGLLTVQWLRAGASLSK